MNVKESGKRRPPRENSSSPRVRRQDVSDPPASAASEDRYERDKKRSRTSSQYGNSEEKNLLGTATSQQPADSSSPRVEPIALRNRQAGQPSSPREVPDLAS